MLKKLLLLAGMALTAVAFMAPAIAQADAWYTDGIKVGVGTTNADEIILHGALTFTVGIFRQSPCYVIAEVDVWNEPIEIEGEEATLATGEVTSFDTLDPCQLFTTGGEPLSGCVIENSTSTAFPWHASLTSNTGLAITGANIGNHYAAGCIVYGIPTNFGFSGTLTGTFNNTTGCIDFVKAGDLLTPPPSVPVSINGFLCATGDLELGPTL